MEVIELNFAACDSRLESQAVASVSLVTKYSAASCRTETTNIYFIDGLNKIKWRDAKIIIGTSGTLAPAGA